jgi:hypothetical protein
VLAAVLSGGDSVLALAGLGALSNSSRTVMTTRCDADGGAELDHVNGPHPTSGTDNARGARASYVGLA